jgi:hypothetical protein
MISVAYNLRYIEAEECWAMLDFEYGVTVSCACTVAEIGMVSSFSDEEMDLSCGTGGILVLQSIVSYSPHPPGKLSGQCKTTERWKAA